jgi:rod shape-determining protein MreC
MDWELYERYRSTLLLAGLLLVSAVLFTFQRASSVHHMRAFLVRFALPPQRFLTQLKAPGTPEAPLESPVEKPSAPPEEISINGRFAGEERRKVDLLSEENVRLREILDLKKENWPKAVVAHVAGRDPQRWFQEIVLDKGKEEGLEVDDPVLADVGGREALVGRIVESSAHLAKVMMLQDSLSAVAATVVGDRGEDGVVEGTNEHDLLLKFLGRGSQVKIGDQVVTSGLGKEFPPGIPIGWVEGVEPDPRQLFMQARLQPAARSKDLRVVLVLMVKGDAE